VLIQLFDDSPVKRFKDPDCPNVFARSRRQGSFVGKDGTSTLSMQRSSSDRIAASINDFENQILYQIIGSEADGFEVVETPLENMMDEADAQEPGQSNMRKLGNHEEEDEKLLSAPAPPPSIRKSSRQKRQQRKERVRGVSRSLEYDDSGGNIDVMVVWTKMAECKLSGEAEDCTVSLATEANMIARVDLAIEETNQAFEESGVQTELRLVHAYRHPTYVETNNDRSYTALKDITYDAIHGVHDTRAEYGADIVALLINANDYCGIAWNLHQGVDKDWMFSVSHYNCATGYYSFGHEIGHNFVSCVRCSFLLCLLVILKTQDHASFRLFICQSVIVN
jgi:hypothetical protein